jgi:inorganic pyrophosphatase
VRRQVLPPLPHAKRGDGDPLDICVISERSITKSDIVLTARVVGGIQMIDDDEADDKIVAVLQNDYFWDKAEDINDLPPVLIERLKHYFSTYKLIEDRKPTIVLDQVYGKEQAFSVINAAIQDYDEAFSNLTK